jgi:hypothetical protein
MALIDFILNIVALLLWLNWRSLRFDPLSRRVPATLVGTLRPAEPERLQGWQWLAGLGLLLVLRALVYWGIGGPVHWTPKLDLGVVTTALYADRPNLHFLYFVYSGLSLLRVALIFYFWLVVLAAVNQRIAEPDPLLKLIRLHLGRSARWPWWVQMLLPMMLAALLWMAVQPMLVHFGLANRAHSTAHLLEQGALVGLGLIFTLKFLLPVVLFLYFVSSYVYLGANPSWDFITSTARNLLQPFKWMRVGKVDFAPVVGMILVILVLHVLPMGVLSQLARHHLSLWPR